MIIVNDDRKVISHHGVKGMRWGIRKDRNSIKDHQAHSKQVLSRNKGKLREDDLDAAKWGSSPESVKLAKSLALSVAVNLGGVTAEAGVGLQDVDVVGRIGKTIKDTFSNYATSELVSRIAMGRYNEDGTRDLSKKVYNKINPEYVGLMGYRLALIVAPIIQTASKVHINNVKYKELLKFESFNAKIEAKRASELADDIFDNPIFKEYKDAFGNG